MAETRNDFLNACFIQDWEDGSYLPFQLMPEEINEQKTINWTDIEIMGRSYPIKGYSSSTPRMVSLQLYFTKEIDKESPRLNLRNISAWLRGLAYPDYAEENDLIRPPRPLRLHIANIIDMKCVAMDVQISHRAPWDFPEEHSGLIEVSVTFAEVGELPMGLRTVRGPGLSGILTAPERSTGGPVR